MVVFLAVFATTSSSESFYLPEGITVREGGPSPAVVPLLAAVQEREGADAVIAPTSAFRGALNRGEVSTEDLAALVQSPRLDFVSIMIDGAGLFELIGDLVFRAGCQFKLSFPQFFGLHVDYDTESCRVREVRYCTWYVSQSHLCRRWSQILPDEAYKVEIEQEYARFVDPLLGSGARVFSSERVNVLADHFAGLFSGEGVIGDDQLLANNGRDTTRFLVASICVVFAGVVSHQMIGQRQK